MRRLRGYLFHFVLLTPGPGTIELRGHLRKQVPDRGGESEGASAGRASCGCLNVSVLKRCLAAAVPCLFLLSGCGLPGTGFHPGVAVVVGDETITTDRVDELTATFCAAVDDQITSGQSIPLAGYKSGIAALLAMISAIDQLNESYDLTPSADYNSQVTQTKSEATGITGDELDAYLEVLSASSYIGDMLTQIGAVELAEEGEEDPTVDFQQARGLDELATWVEREGVTFDPRYGYKMVDGEPQAVNTEVTFAFSDVATGAKVTTEDGSADPGYVAALPQSATCG